jgi:acylphosphatase
MPLERRRVFYSGRVQGVGFRFTTERIAADFAVSGFVRNLDDGRVEVLVEGEPAVVDQFLEAVERQLQRHIRDVRQEHESPGDPPLDGFIIRY